MSNLKTNQLNFGGSDHKASWVKEQKPGANNLIFSIFGQSKNNKLS